MDELNSKKKSPEEPPVQEVPPTVNTDFINEKIKQRPLNRKRLTRRMIITACMAVLFGLIACVSFLVLEPVINNALYPPEKTEPVTFPEETQQEEMSPSEMIVDDNEMTTEEESAPTVDRSVIEQEVKRVLAAQTQDVSGYQRTYTSLKNVAQDAGKAMVTVTGVNSDVDWFNDPYESSGKTSGVIVADTGVEILIVVHANDLIDAEKLQVTFQDGAQANAKVKAEDGLLGLSVVTVADADLSETTKSQLAVATLGSSSMAELTGTPVITIGAPAGIVGSICYGTITSAVSELPIADASYKRITTDIYGNSHASGVMVNLNGQVIGIIDMQHNDADSQNVISAIGITECKPLIEKLSNGQEKAYLGIHATDVTETAQQELKIPAGAYITKIDMDSPAMNAGIQSGDVITAFNDIPISSTLELINELNKTAPGRSAELLIMRQGPDEYSEMHITLSFTSTKSLKAE